ncbi:MAG: flippase-like domain-containing protein [Anaerolineales bacterium]|nr:flippase-like domain-containing protein [Anaerolineales bacterium]
MFNGNLRRKLVIGFGLALAVFVGLIFYGDAREMGRLLHNFQWSLVPAILGLTLVNYFLRGIRFHYYLGQIGLKQISFWTSFRVFIGGFALTLTPGKVGELVRVLWLKNLANADPIKLAPSTIVDRIIDGMALALLATLGVLAYPQYWTVAVSILALITAGIALLQIRPLALALLNGGEHLPLVSRFVHHLHTLYENTRVLLSFKNLLVGLGLGLVSWSAEGLAFYLVLRGLGINGGIDLAAIAVFILALGSILGGVSSLPGGLGAAEVTMTGMLQALAHLPENSAATATLLIRFCTLWFAILLGVLTIAIWRGMFLGTGQGEPKEDMASTTAPLRHLNPDEGW